MALGSHEPKKLTASELFDRAQALDLRRQEQIQNQVNIINRMRDEIMLYDAYMNRIVGERLETTAVQVAEECLEKVDKIRAEHRARNREEKQDGK